MSELIVENIHLSYDQNQVLHGVDLRIEKGEIVSLLGASGSGKTTLLRAVAGLESPNKGLIKISGNTVYNAQQGIEVPAEQRHLGLVFQSYALWPHKTVYNNVAYPLQLRKLNKSEIKDKVLGILEQLGLQGLDQRYPAQLSGGQQQRVAIARALVYNPPVMLLDEPLSNLDAKLREEARAFLRELIIGLDISALLVTHDQHEAMAISDRILLLNHGKIEQEGSPEEIYSSPQTLYTAEFMGSNNLIYGTVERCEGKQALIAVDDQMIWGTTHSSLSPGTQVCAVIRVEQVKIEVQPQAQNTLPLHLSTNMYLGDRWEYLFRKSKDAGVSSGQHTLRAYGLQPLTENKYNVFLPPEQLWIYPSQK